MVNEACRSLCALVDEVEGVGVAVRHDIAQAEALEAHGSHVGSYLESLNGLVAVALAAGVPSDDAGHDVVVNRLTGFHDVVYVRTFLFIGTVVAGIDVQGIGRAVGEVVEVEVKGLRLASCQRELALLVGHHSAAVLINDEQWCEHILAVGAVAVVGDGGAEVSTAVVDDVVAAWVIGRHRVLGFDNHREVDLLGFLALGDGDIAAANGFVAAILVDAHEPYGLVACRGGSDVEGHHRFLAGKNLGLHNGGVLRVLVNLLSAKVEIQVTKEAVNAVVLDGHVHLLLHAHALTAGELPVGGGEVDDGVCTCLARGVAHVHLKVVAVGLLHEFPVAGAFHLINAHKVIGASEACTKVDHLVRVDVNAAAKAVGLSLSRSGDSEVDVVGRVGEHFKGAVGGVQQGESGLELLARARVVTVAHLNNLRLVDPEGIVQSIAVPSAGATGGGGGECRLFLILVRRSATRNDIVDDVLLHVVALGARRAANAAGVGVHDGKLEVAVAHASPSPVDVEVVAILIAVANERVSTAAACCAVVDHGAAGSELFIHHVVPHLLGVVVAVGELRAVAKEGEALGDVVGVGTGGRHAILRLDGAAHVEHQVSHCRGVDLVLGTGVGVAHVSPVKGGDRQLGHVNGRVVVVAVAVGEGIGGNHLRSGHRIFVEVHQLRHRGGNAASVGKLIAVLFVVRDHELGALVPVGSSLVPLGGDQGGDRVACVHSVLGFRSGDSALDASHFVEQRDLLRIVVEPCLHVGGSFCLVEVALIAIAQNGVDAVVASDDDETLVVTNVEYIVGCFVASSSL